MTHSPLPGTFPHNLNRALQYIEDDQSNSFETTMARAELAQAAASLNSHQALVEALQAIVDDHDMLDNPEECVVSHSLIERACAALALAGGASV